MKFYIIFQIIKHCVVDILMKPKLDLVVCYSSMPMDDLRYLISRRKRQGRILPA